MENLVQFMAGLPDSRYRVVRYEDLLEDPSTVVRGLCDFLGVPFLDRLLQPYDARASRMTSGIYGGGSRMLGDARFDEFSQLQKERASAWPITAASRPLSWRTWSVAARFGYLPWERNAGPATAVRAQGPPARPLPVFRAGPLVAA